MSKPSILLISDVFPFPRLAGDSIRTFEFVRALADIAQVHLVAPYAVSHRHLLGTAQRQLAHLCETFHLFERRNYSKEPLVWRWAYKLPVVRTIVQDNHCRRDVVKAVEAIISHKAVDVVWFEKTFTAHYLSKMKQIDGRSVVNTHNVESLSTWDRAVVEQSGVKLIWGYLLHMERLLYERYWLPQMDRIIAVSNEDATYYRRFLNSERVVIVPNFIDLSAYPPSPHRHREIAVCMTGSMNYRPNSDAALFFFRDIWPQIKSRVPNGRLYIVGKNPPAEVRALASDDVIVTGYVPSVIPYLQKCRVAVVPLRSGGGTRLKILEAMACELPVVSTSVGCRGLEVMDGVHLLIADRPREFANAVVRVLSDESLAHRLARKALSLVREKYSRVANARRVHALIEDLLRA